MMVNLLDDSNFHRQTAVMTRLIEMIIQNDYTKLDFDHVTAVSSLMDRLIDLSKNSL